MKKTNLLAALLLSVTGLTAQADGNIQITEWMYNPLSTGGEFVEFTNLGNTAVDFTGWSFDDSSRAAGSFSLSALGLVQPGESVILTESTAAAFRSAWGLADTVKVIGGNNQNLGRADEMNIYDAASTLVDRLSYDDATIAGTFRTQGASGNPLSLSDLASTTATANWVLAKNGDAFGSHVSTVGDIGNPGLFLLASPVPEPTTLTLMFGGMLLLGVTAARRAKK